MCWRGCASGVALSLCKLECCARPVCCLGLRCAGPDSDGLQSTRDAAALPAVPPLDGALAAEADEAASIRGGRGACVVDLRHAVDAWLT
eukprot:3584075-Rhodomonas_salina.1